MKLQVVRHGQTEHNVLGLVQGDTESDLTEKGREDAKALQELVASLNIDVVVSSPLRRAVDTAKLITNNKYEIIIDDRLIERNNGIFEGKKKLSEMNTFTAAFGRIVDKEEILDEAIVLVMKAPHTYTTEDTVEIDS